MDAQKNSFRIRVQLNEYTEKYSHLFNASINRKSLIGQFIVNLITLLEKQLGSKEKVESFIIKVAAGNTENLNTLIEVNQQTEPPHSSTQPSIEEDINLENFVI